MLQTYATGGTTFDRRYAASRDGLMLNRVDGGRVQSYFYWQGKPIASAGQLDGAQFDYGFTPISSAYPPATGGSYTVQGGDTLESIAQNIWGDSGLWYMLADANGLSSNNDLRPGDALKIPNVVSNVHDNYNTFKFYNPNEVIGDTTPSPKAPPPPPPPKKKCGGLAMVVMVVVAVVATVLTAGAMGAVFANVILNTMFVGAVSAAVGSAASQLVGKAMGVVDHFSWKQVAQAGIQGGLTAGLGGFNAGTGVVAAMENAAVVAVVAVESYAINYVSNKMAGIDTHFSWRDMATQVLTSSVTAGVMQGTGLNSALDKLPGGGSGASARWNLGNYAKSAISADLSAAANDKWFGGSRPNYGMVAASAAAHVLGNDLGGWAKDQFGNQTGADVAKKLAPERDQGTAQEKPRLFNDWLSDKVKGANEQVAGWFRAPEDSKTFLARTDAQVGLIDVQLKQLNALTGQETAIQDLEASAAELGITIAQPNEGQDLILGDLTSHRIVGDSTVNFDRDNQLASYGVKLINPVYRPGEADSQFSLQKVGNFATHTDLTTLVLDAFIGYKNPITGKVFTAEDELMVSMATQIPDAVSFLDATQIGERTLITDNQYLKGTAPGTESWYAIKRDQAAGLALQGAGHVLDGKNVIENAEYKLSAISEVSGWQEGDDDQKVRKLLAFGILLHGLEDVPFHSELPQSDAITLGQLGASHDEIGPFGHTKLPDPGHWDLGQHVDYPVPAKVEFAKMQLIRAMAAYTGASGADLERRVDIINQSVGGVVTDSGVYAGSGVALYDRERNVRQNTEKYQENAIWKQMPKATDIVEHGGPSNFTYEEARNELNHYVAPAAGVLQNYHLKTSLLDNLLQVSQWNANHFLQHDPSGWLPDGVSVKDLLPNTPWPTPSQPKPRVPLSNDVRVTR